MAGTRRAEQDAAAEERAWCRMQWRPDFSPSSDGTAHAEALWSTRPPGIVVSTQANQELWADRDTEDLLEWPEPPRTGRDDLRRRRPVLGTAADPLHAALPNVHRTVLVGAGHAPWAEQPDPTRDVITRALASQLPR